MQSNPIHALILCGPPRPDALSISPEVTDAAGSRRTEAAARALRIAHLQSLAAFWDCLNAFDWGFEYSDDPGVYRRGKTAIAEFQRRAGDSMAHAELYSRFANYASARNRNADGDDLNVPAKPGRPVLPS